jgi:hypothetical protein
MHVRRSGVHGSIILSGPTFFSETNLAVHFLLRVEIGILPTRVEPVLTSSTHTPPELSFLPPSNHIGLQYLGNLPTSIC